jgi:hypothetical protein
MITVVGIDLAGSKKRHTGICAMNDNLECSTSVLHSDQEILDWTVAARPSVVSVDAPLSLPRGRKSLDEKGPPHFRECDRELLRMRIRFFPISLGPMRMLTARGMRLRAELEGNGLVVIESFPGAAQDVLGLPRKQAGLPALESGLRKYGVRLKRRAQGYTGDELDSVTSALVGLLYVRGESKAIGDPSEGLMILPRPRYP